jgi:hypothetical protein
MYQNAARKIDQDHAAIRGPSPVTAVADDAAPVVSPVHALHDRLAHEIDLRRERAAIDSFSAKQPVRASGVSTTPPVAVAMLAGAAGWIALAMAMLYRAG